MQGPKTHEQQLRILEKKPDVPDRRQAGMALERSEDNSRFPRRPTAREGEFPVSRSGMNQESDHNKHNDPGQPGHKPQQPTVLEEKQNK
jgi:hypothetical protein